MPAEVRRQSQEAKLMQPTRRTVLAQALAAAVAPALATVPARTAFAADAYPSRPIKWIVPYLPGTAPDTTARQFGEAVSALLGQPVVIDNRPGAAGNIGARLAATAAPDGYTWVYSAAPMAANMRMYKEPGYDAIKDFRHLMRLTAADCALIVNAESDIRTLDDLVRKARAQPGKLDYSSGGVGTPSHLGMELLLSAEGVKANHVPYKGASDLINAVLSRQVTFGLPITSVAVPQIKAGKLRALAVTGPRRNPALPQVATLKELGVQNVELVSWGGISVPAGTPDAVAARILEAFQAAVKQPKLIAAINATGGQIDAQDPATYTRGFTTEMAQTEVMMQKARLEAM